MNRLDIITNEDFITANETADSILTGLYSLGLKPYTDHYRWYKERCQILSLQPPVFDKPKYLIKYSNSEMFILNPEVKPTGKQLKTRLIRDFKVSDLCSMDGCPNPRPYWNGRRLTLQVDHINGNNVDNRVENLRLLCPNCHTQTDTFCGVKKPYVKKLYFCLCGNEKSRNANGCRKCAGVMAQKNGIGKRVNYPPADIILQMVSETCVRAAALVIGVSDNGLRKHMKVKHDIII